MVGNAGPWQIFFYKKGGNTVKDEFHVHLKILAIVFGCLV